MIECSFRNGFSVCAEPWPGLAEVLVTLVGRCGYLLRLSKPMQKYHPAEHRRDVGQFPNQVLD